MKGKALQAVITLSFFLFLTYSIKAAEPLSVVINEIAWMGTKIEGVESKNWWRYEWLELYNDASTIISLDGWKIELYRTELDWSLELKGNVPPNGYFLIVSSDKIPNYDLNYSNLGGKFNNSGQKVVLKNNLGEIIETIDCFSNSKWFAGDNSTKQTMERKNSLTSGNSPENWQTSQDPGGTPKTENSQRLEIGFPSIEEKATSTTETVETPLDTSYEDLSGQITTTSSSQHLPEPQPQKIEPQTKTYPSNIFINEILPSPEGSDAENEWIELFNGNDFEVDLSDWHIRDTVGAIRTYTWSPGAKIAPRRFFLVRRTENNITLQNSGDGLELLNPNGEIVHKISYQKAPRGQSFNRVSLEKEFLAPLEKDSLMGQTEQAETNWDWSASSTPGEINIITKPEIPKTEFPGTSEANEEKTNPPQVSDVEKNKKALAKIGAELPRSSSSLFIFLIAVAIAISSAIIVLILKKRIKGEEENIVSDIQNNTFKYK